MVPRHASRDSAHRVDVPRRTTDRTAAGAHGPRDRRRGIGGPLTAHRPPAGVKPGPPRHRRAPSGHPALVAVALADDRPGVISLAYAAHTTGGSTFSSASFYIWLQRPGAMLRLYAGQLDPADAAHFTIAYGYGGEAGTIDG